MLRRLLMQRRHVMSPRITSNCRTPRVRSGGYGILHLPVWIGNRKNKTKQPEFRANSPALRARTRFQPRRCCFRNPALTMSSPGRNGMYRRASNAQHLRIFLMALSIASTDKDIRMIAWPFKLAFQLFVATLPSRPLQVAARDLDFRRIATHNPATYIKKLPQWWQKDERRDALPPSLALACRCVAMLPLPRLLTWTVAQNPGRDYDLRAFIAERSGYRIDRGCILFRADCGTDILTLLHEVLTTDEGRCLWQAQRRPMQAESLEATNETMIRCFRRESRCDDLPIDTFLRLLNFLHHRPKYLTYYEASCTFARAEELDNHILSSEDQHKELARTVTAVESECKGLRREFESLAQTTQQTVEDLVCYPCSDLWLIAWLTEVSQAVRVDAANVSSVGPNDVGGSGRSRVRAKLQRTSIQQLRPAVATKLPV